MSHVLNAIAERLGADARITAQEALELRKTVFPDGIVSRGEAEVLIALEARVANTDEEWAAAFVEAIVDHALGAGQFPGHVEEHVAQWLISRFGQDGARETELEVVLKLMERSESAPESLALFAHRRVAAQFAGKPIGDVETELVRRCLYASAGHGATAVTEEEARWLFQLDAQSANFANAPSWGDLFVKAVLNHLMGRRAPALLEQQGMLARQVWLARPQGLGASFAAMFDGGLRGFWAKVREASPSERLAAHYEQSNAEAEKDANLTLTEIAWAVGMSKEDDRHTANELALLDAIRELEPERA